MRRRSRRARGRSPRSRVALRVGTPVRGRAPRGRSGRSLRETNRPRSDGRGRRARRRSPRPRRDRRPRRAHSIARPCGSPLRANPRSSRRDSKAPGSCSGRRDACASEGVGGMHGLVAAEPRRNDEAARERCGGHVTSHSCTPTRWPVAARRSNIVGARTARASLRKLVMPCTSGLRPGGDRGPYDRRDHRLDRLEVGVDASSRGASPDSASGRPRRVGRSHSRTRHRGRRARPWGPRSSAPPPRGPKTRTAVTHEVRHRIVMIRSRLVLRLEESPCPLRSANGSASGRSTRSRTSSRTSTRPSPATNRCSARSRSPTAHCRGVSTGAAPSTPT